MTSEDDILGRLETLNAIGVALSSEKDIGSLLERILEAAREFARADGGTLYRVKGNTLVFEVLRNDTLGYFMGGKHGKSIDFAPLLRPAAWSTPARVRSDRRCTATFRRSRC